MVFIPKKIEIEKKMLSSLSSNIPEEIKHVLEAQIFPSKGFVRICLVYCVAIF